MKPFLTILLLALPVHAGLVGAWDFEDPTDLGKATFGPDLGIIGTAPTHAASLDDDSGTPLSGVITTAGGIGNHLSLDHGLGNSIEEYTLVVDVLSPFASRSSWRSIYQTDSSNSDDADYFITTDDLLGVGTIGYSSVPIDETAWTRLVVSVKNGAGGHCKTYLDGGLHHTHIAQGTGSRISLDATMLLFADENNENAPLHIAKVALYDEALDATAVGRLGGPADGPTVWNVNVGGSSVSTTNAITTGDNYRGAAIENTPDSTWNAVSATAQVTLDDSVGNNTEGVTFMIAPTGGSTVTFGGQDLNAGDKIFNTWIKDDGNDDLFTVTFGSLPDLLPGESYSLIIYSDWWWKNGNSGQTITQTAGTGLSASFVLNRYVGSGIVYGNVGSLLEDADPGNTNPPSAAPTNYARLDGLVPDLYDNLSFTMGGVNGPINGFQLVKVPVPIVVTNASDSDPGSLREAIALSPAGSTITFDPALSNQTITLTNGQLLIDKSLTIDASDLPGGITIDANQNSRVMVIQSGNTVTLNSLTITGGRTPDAPSGQNAAHGGGIYNDGGDLTLTNSTLSGNSTGNGGNSVFGIGGDGGIGGGIYSAGGSVTLTNSTVAGNSTGSGGSGGFDGGDAGDGGGIYSADDSVTLNNSTVSSNSTGNSGSGDGGGIYISSSGTVTLTNSIIAANAATSSPDIYLAGTLNRTGANLVPFLTNDGGTLNGPAHLTGDPKLAPLGWYGGPTRTMHPLAGSPAIDAAGTSDPGGTDQRGFLRLVGTTVDIGAVEAGPALTVDTVSNSGAGSLRQAIADAGGQPGTRIYFDSGVFPATITTTSQLTIGVQRNVFIDASDIPGGVTLQSNGSQRVLLTQGSSTVAMHSLTLTGGNSSTMGQKNGGGLRVLDNSSATLANCTVSDCQTSASGGGISVESGSRLLAVQVTVSGNTAGTGGGLFNVGGTSLLLHATISGNTAGTGGGLSNTGGGSVTLGNSIVAANTAPSDVNVSGTIIQTGTNLTSGDPLLAPLGDYGGPTQTMHPMAGSPAIDPPGGATSPTGTDQRGFPRLVGLTVDIGAVESGNAIPDFIDPEVSTLADSIDGLGTNGISLREAISFASPGSTITFDSSLADQTSTLGGTHLTINRDLTINASALAGGITIDAQGNSRVMKITGSPTVVLDSITLTGGRTPDATMGSAEHGGGICKEGGDLTLFNSTLSGNSTSSGGHGGGIYSSSGSVNLSHSNLSGNFTGNSGFGGGGGGIYSSSGSVTLTHSILSNNSTGNGSDGGYGGEGGGIYSSGGSVTLTHSILSGNSTGDGGDANSDGDGGSGGRGGGISSPSGSVTLIHSTLSGNSTGHGGNGGNGDNGGNGGSGGSGGPGGGIYSSSGSVTLAQSTLSDNSTGDGGDGGNGDGEDDGGSGGNNGGFGGDGGSSGGIFSISSIVTLTNSTLSGNTTGNGGTGGIGGIGSYGGSGGNGGNGGNAAGIFTSGETGGSATTLSLSACTLSGNTTGDGGTGGSGGSGGFGGGEIGDGGDGGGIYSWSTGIVTLANSIIAANAAISGPDIFQDGNYDSNSGVNFIGDTTNAGTNLGTVLTGDPLLAPLGWYGGPTQTMAPLPGSPAIDAAGTTDPGGTDQRGPGFDRFVGTALDIGAVETGNAIPDYHLTTIDGTSGVSGFVPHDAAFDYGGTQFHVKNSGNNASTTRKGYLRFDTGSAPWTATSLELVVSLIDPSIADTDQTIYVYGLTDESLDDWDPSTMTWANAPGNDTESGHLVDGGKTTLLGTFQLDYNGDKASPAGTVISFSSQALIDFLNADTNGLVTIILGRTPTGTTGSKNLLFASDNHPTLPPPALRRGTPDFVGSLLVTASDDEDSATPGVSLREAIAYSNPGATISFDPSVFTGGPANTITLGGTQLLIDKSLTIDASDITGGVTIDADQQSRIMEVTGTGNVTLDTLTLTGGNTSASESGGAIWHDGGGVLTLQDCTLTDNASGQHGGAIRNGGTSTLILRDTTVSNNSASNQGGGLSNAGPATLERCTLSGNAAGGIGGGIMNGSASADLNATNCTISGNTANGGTTGGGGLNNALSAIATLIHCTISDNHATGGSGKGGGIRRVGGTVTIENSLVAGNTAPTNPNLQGTIVERGNNLISGDPLLAPLDNYGGLTQTMPPLPGSPVIEGATLDPAITTDQRGLARPNGPLPDIGAAEAYPFTDLTLVDMDTDGIDDRLEIGIFGDLTTATDTTDTDRDGSSDKDEIANMTNALDGRDFFRILDLGPAAGFDPQANPLVTVTVSTFPGLEYAFDTDATLQNFEEIPGSTFIADGFTATFEIPLGANGDFIRGKRN